MLVQRPHRLRKKNLGYKTICTASSEKKLKKCEECGADFMINYKEVHKWENRVKEITMAKDTDVIFDCVGGGPYFEKNLAAIAKDGKWVLYGLLGGVKLPESMCDGRLISQLLGRRVNILASMLNSRSDEYKGDLVASFKKNVLPKLAEDVVAPVIDKTFHFENVADANDRMEKIMNMRTRLPCLRCSCRKIAKWERTAVFEYNDQTYCC